MKIEKKYYTENKQMLAEIDQKIQQENLSLSESEREAEWERSVKEVAALFESAQAWHDQHPKILNPQKHARFQKLVKSALWFADDSIMDVSIEQKNNLNGFIRLEADYLMLDELAPPKAHKIFRQLFSNCDTFSITHKPSTFIIEYIFELYDTVNP